MRIINKYSGLVSLGLAVFLNGCSSDSGSSSASPVAVDASLPTVMQSEQSSQGSVGLLSLSASLTSVDATENRVISISDTSSCSLKLEFNPASLNLTIDGDQQTFEIIAPSGHCVHTVSFTGDGVSTSTNTSQLDVIEDAVVSVGLYGTDGQPTNTIMPGESFLIKFNPPVSWEDVTEPQTYQITDIPSGITLTPSTCTLNPSDSVPCIITVDVSDSAVAGDYSFSVSPATGTVVPVDKSSLPFTIGEVVVNVGLYGSDGQPVTTIMNGQPLYIRFTPPEDWADVTSQQTYQVTDTPSGFSLNKSSCTLDPSNSVPCSITAQMASSVSAGNYSFSVGLSSGTVPLDQSNLPFVVENVVVNVGLYGSDGKPSDEFEQDGTMVIKFTPPDDWANITTNQTYEITNSVSGISLDATTCILSPSSTESCLITGDISESMTSGNYSFSIQQGINTIVPVDNSIVSFTIDGGVSEPLALIANSFRGNILSCSIADSGELSDCAKTSEPSAIGAYDDIALSPRSNVAYILSADGTVLHCDINSSGDLLNCNSSNTPEINSFGIKVNGQGDLAYITHKGDNAISICNIDSDNLFNCGDLVSNSLFNSVSRITLNSSETVAFITNGEIKDTTIVVRCDVAQNGALSNCSDSGASGFTSAGGIALNALGDKAFIVSPTAGKVFVCDVSESGVFSACSNTGTPALFEPIDIALSSGGTKAFVTNLVGIVTCDVSKEGLFSNCNASAPEADEAAGIVLVNY